MRTGDTSTIPQADELDTLRGVVELVAHRRATAAVASSKLGLSDRHWGYYRKAALSIGLVAEVGGGLRLTDVGTRLLITEEGSREEALVYVAAMRGSPALAPFIPFLEGHASPTYPEIVTTLSGSFAASTAMRRAGTLRTWRNQLVRRLGGAHGVAPRLPEQLSLRAAPRWPVAGRFPHNDGARERRVRDILLPDIEASSRVLAITGYGSLDVVLEILGGAASAPEHVRIAFGVEPHPDVAASRLRSGTIADEVRDHWLAQGISVKLCMPIIRVLALLDAGRLEVRLSPSHQGRLHAKVFVTDRAVTLGSSNLSHNGLEHLLEANARFERESERERYDEAGLLAEALWDSAHDYPEFRDLLNALLRRVSWREALARACAELLEGDWAEHAGWKGLTDAQLWPSQRTGIARALWVLEEVGSVLVADATGSGKTRMAAHLLRALRNRLSCRGHVSDRERVDPVVACPPSVAESWEDELVPQGLHTHPISHGRLSRPDSNGSRHVRRMVERTQILAIDEGHRFLNRASNRTAAVVGSLADHVLVFTATPISRSADDLVGIVDLLGADNLEPEVLDMLERVWRRRSHRLELDQGQQERLRRELRRFTVRRTRHSLNQLIDREPHLYMNQLGKRCRYPEPHALMYDLGESAEDRALAAQILAAASGLRGLAFLRSPIELSGELRRAGVTEEAYAARRLRGAQAFARHHVLAALRSSRAALWEHLFGTVAASQQYGTNPDIKGSHTGNVVEHVERAAARQEPLAHPLAHVLPPWLTDLEEHRAAARREQEQYAAMADALRAMSSGREQAKAALLSRLADGGRATIAFDSRPISLAVIRDLVRRESSGRRVVLALGGNDSARRTLQQAFGLLAAGSTAPIGLCSDAMSEGLNLQRGAAVVHLDMPSNVRQAEQRVGRIMRMDSPHASIDVWWPRDAEEFALRTDERFVGRVDLVEALLGGNIELPDELRSTPVRPEELIEELETDEPEVAFDDAFAPVAALVEGPTALVPRDVYAHIRTSKVRVVSSVSVVRSRTPWVFVAIRAAGSGAPRWAVVREGSVEPPVRDLGDVAEQLRSLLVPGVEDLEFDEEASDRLVVALQTLGRHERLLLPPKKRRALDQMAEVLRHYDRLARADLERKRVIDRLRSWLDPDDATRAIDLRDLADGWLRAIDGRWRQRLAQREARSRPILLKHLTKTLISDPLSTEELLAAFAGVRADRPVDQRVVAAIVGRP